MENIKVDSQIVNILGAGPAGYEAALVAIRLGARVTLFERTGIGGSSILTDCVPSKALVSASLRATNKNLFDGRQVLQSTSLNVINSNILALAKHQSEDIENSLLSFGVKIVKGQARLLPDKSIIVDEDKIHSTGITLLSTGATPRLIDGDKPDAKRIFTWDQLYKLDKNPEHLIIIGSGVTGAEFACAYLGLGIKVTLISSREHVLPGNDSDASKIVEDVFSRLGGVILPHTRASSVHLLDEDKVSVKLSDGNELIGSHVLVSIGAIPNSRGLGLEELGVKVNDAGYITVDKVSRTNVSGIYAAGDVTGVFSLASVAAGQGRTAMAHALGDEVVPLNKNLVPSAVFTNPEIASVGDCVLEEDGKTITFPLYSNPRAKMDGITEGFIKLYSRNDILSGAVICSPQASELIHSLTLAISQRITTEDYARAYTVYPSLTGSLAEAARRLASQ